MAPPCTRYHYCMRSGTQLAARFEPEVVAEVDRLIAEGRVDSRADALRLALDAYLDAARRRSIGERIAEGYREFPQTDEELAGAEASARAMIAEEPW